MFEDFKRITIEGGYFEQPTQFELFKQKQELSIIYGRNGSGKTSIAKAIRQLVGKDNQPDGAEKPFTITSDAIIPEDKKQSVYIFDEDFVQDNVKTKGNGLETIVMMGEQVDLDAQISAQNTEKSAVENAIAKQTSLKENFENAGNTSSPIYFLKKISEELRKNDGWADKDRIVKGNKGTSHITEEFVKKWAAIDEPAETEEVLKQQLDNDYKLYTQTDDAQVIAWELKPFGLPSDLNDVKTLLEKRVEKPELSDREQRLLSFLQGHSHYYIDTTKQLAEEKWQFCPLCLREAGEQDYANINDTLKQLLNKESKLYNDELEKALSTFADVNIVLPTFPNDLNAKERTDAQLAIEQLNNDLTIIRDRIILRQKDIYNPMEESFNSEEMESYIKHIKGFKISIKE